MGRQRGPLTGHRDECDGTVGWDAGALLLCRCTRIDIRNGPLMRNWAKKLLGMELKTILGVRENCMRLSAEHPQRKANWPSACRASFGRFCCICHNCRGRSMTETERRWGAPRAMRDKGLAYPSWAKEMKEKKLLTGE